MAYYDEEHSTRAARNVMHVGDAKTGEAIRRVVRQLPGDALDLAVYRCRNKRSVWDGSGDAAWGVELNPEYAELCAARLSQSVT